MDKRTEFIYGHAEEIEIKPCRFKNEEPFVVQELKAKADLYLQRNKIYGSNYMRFGPILSLILEGQKLDASDPQQMNRIGIFVQIIAKITRYGENFCKGGHDDSLDDIAVYSMMLKQLDNAGK